MSAAKHTPEPWRVAGPGEGMNADCLRIIASDDDLVIADVWPQGHDDDTEEQEANGRMMAYAPLLLTELETFLERVTRYHPHTAEMFGGPARAAIARARGES